ncbi:hypothetical protein RclHR1_05590016 [Rhizophagus clarus]|uniref:Uncharacterized protein n=1 Tax=Rhizophagus clarus TaxID=94130 RepID=A0A2Z6RPU3_9GLOM|nr:hypothetical protein RclHR1_05590016 [Rhizophagus clarus]
MLSIMSNAQSIDSLREVNARLLVEISELRKKFAEVEAENAKLKQIIEENARRDARVEELEQKNTELKARLAIVPFSMITDQFKFPDRKLSNISYHISKKNN